MKRLFGFGRDREAADLLTARVTSLSHERQGVLVFLEQDVIRLNKLKQENEDLQKKLKSISFRAPTRAQSLAEEDAFLATVEMPSIFALKEGWRITMKDWDSYEDFTHYDGIVVSVVGNYNRGKTFLLGQLSGSPVPEGFNVNTSGLSINCFENKKSGGRLPIFMLDSKGSSLPYDAKTPLFSPKDSLHRSGDFGVEDENIKLQLQDHGATEDIVQSFVLKEADVILVVVADINFEDQILVNKIKKKLPNDGSKRMIVVHNLYHTHTRDDVRYKIEDSIMKAFHLERYDYTYCDREKHQNTEFFLEVTSNGLKIPHVIIAKQDSEAGDFYNETSFQYIRGYISSSDQRRKIDILKSLHEHLIEYLPYYARTKPNLNEHLIMKEQKGKPTLFQLLNHEDLKLKSYQSDELGFLKLFKDGFQPPYEIYTEWDGQRKTLCLSFECADGAKDLRASSLKLSNTGDHYVINVVGEKLIKNVPNDLLFNNRQEGSFSLKIESLEKQKFELCLQTKAEITYENGMVTFRWRVLEKHESPEEPQDCEYDDP